MRTHTANNEQTSGLGVSRHACPECKGPLHRAVRRPVDHLTGLFVPVRRYRCHHFACQWEGNFRKGVGDGKDRGALGSHLQGVKGAGKPPMSFVVHMAIVAVGLVLVLVVSLIEPVDESKLPRNSIAVSPDPR